MALQVIFMDAGQGDATLLIYPDGSLVLVDCGCIMNNGVVTKGIKTLLEEHLAKTGNRLRALVLTHPHQDHYNLVDKLIVKPEVTVDNIFIGGLVDQYQVNDLSVWLTKNKVLPLADHHLTDIPAAGLSIPAGKWSTAGRCTHLGGQYDRPRPSGQAQRKRHRPAGIPR